MYVVIKFSSVSSFFDGNNINRISSVSNFCDGNINKISYFYIVL